MGSREHRTANGSSLQSHVQDLNILTVVDLSRVGSREHGTASGSYLQSHVQDLNRITVTDLRWGGR